MTYSYSPWLLPLLVSLGCLVLVGVYAVRRRQEPQARTFALLMLTLIVWTACYIMGLASQELAGKIVWMRLKYVGSVSAPLIWLVFSVQFTQNEGWLTRRVRTGLWVFYLLTLGVVFTSNWQTWMWGTVWIEPGLLEEQVTHGWYFWFYVACSYLFIIISAWLYVRFMLTIPPIHKRQALLMAVGGLIPLLGRIALDGFGLNLIPQLDEVILFFLASALIFGVALFRFSLLAIMPVAYSQVFQSMGIGVVVLDPQTQLLEMNPAAKKLIGVGPLGLLGTPLKRLWPQLGDLNLEAENVTDRAFPGEEGSLRHYRIRVTLIRNRWNRLLGYLLLLTDITQQKKDAAALELLATRDGLTGLFNRRTFMTLAAQEHQRALRYHHSFAVILFDLDDFKQINDTYCMIVTEILNVLADLTLKSGKNRRFIFKARVPTLHYGHLCGDEVLQEVARRCQERLRSVDLLGRYGGEEFVILLPETGQSDAEAVAEKIRSVIGNTPIQLVEIQISIAVTISVGGIVFTPDDQEAMPSFDTIFSRADEMMYASKKAGRNCITMWNAAS
jgi:diguanylate cyclase (GGDEF)-like protein/PAS domain S-box-containing protein